MLFYCSVLHKTAIHSSTKLHRPTIAEVQQYYRRSQLQRFNDTPHYRNCRCSTILQDRNFRGSTIEDRTAIAEQFSIVPQLQRFNDTPQDSNTAIQRYYTLPQFRSSRILDRTAIAETILHRTAIAEVQRYSTRLQLQRFNNTTQHRNCRGSTILHITAITESNDTRQSRNCRSSTILQKIATAAVQRY